MKQTIALIALLFLTGLNSSNAQAQCRRAQATPLIKWNAYTQVRGFYSDNADGFEMRRTKFWVKGNTPVEGLTFKAQTLFRWGSVGQLVLQDVFMQYTTGSFTFKAGQFVPKFSLEWSQPDAYLPISERAKVVDALIPASQTLGRDIGVETLFSPGNGWFKTWLGVYNGKGFNYRPKTDRDYMFTNRTLLSFSIGSLHIHTGGSAVYRKTSGTAYDRISGKNQLFSGIDRRYGLELRLKAGSWHLQTEYLNTRLDRSEARGWYVLTDYDFTDTDNLALSEEQYTDLLPSTIDKPWYIVVYSHYFNQHNFKLMFDNRVQTDHQKTYYQSVLQLQLFFNS